MAGSGTQALPILSPLSSSWLRLQTPDVHSGFERQGAPAFGPVRHDPSSGPFAFNAQLSQRSRMPSRSVSGGMFA